MRATYGATEYGKVGIESAVSGADPHELISILFSQLKKELVAAEYHCKAKNFELYSSKVTKANRILAGLQGRSIELSEAFMALIEQECAEFGFELLSPKNADQRGSQISFGTADRTMAEG